MATELGGIVLVRLGAIEQARGNLGKAMEYFQNYFQIIQRLADKDLVNVSWQKDLAIACDWLAFMYKKRNNPTQARVYSDQAAKIRQWLSSRQAGR